MIKRIVIVSLLGMSVAVGLAWVYRAEIVATPAVISLAAEFMKGTGSADILTDGNLHVILCGTGTPKAPGRTGPCTIVVAGGELIVIDAGSGAEKSIIELGLPIDHLTAVLITHHHSDHISGIDDIVNKSWVDGRGWKNGFRDPVKLYGPPGTRKFVESLQQMYALDIGYRTANRVDEMFPMSGEIAMGFDVPPPQADFQSPVFVQNELRVSAFRVSHSPVDPAYGYRIEYKGKVVVVSGDTRRHDPIIQHAKDADILVHEAVAGYMVDALIEHAKNEGDRDYQSLLESIRHYHTRTLDAADIAQKAGVKKLVFTHLIPDLPDILAQAVFRKGVGEIFSGEIIVGRDRTHIVLTP